MVRQGRCTLTRDNSNGRWIGLPVWNKLSRTTCARINSRGNGVDCASDGYFY